MGIVSSLTSRFVVSGGNSLNVGVGAGILSIGDYHGGAIENAMSSFYAWGKLEKKEVSEFVKAMIEKKETIYGFGHKHYKEGDPRVKWLLETVKEIGFESKYLHFKDIVEETFETVKGKKIHCNIDGIIAMLLCDFGFDPLLGKGIFIIGRTPGLVAQVHEELVHEKPVRRVSEDNIEYIHKDSKQEK